MTGFLALIIGCLECQEDSTSLGIFPTYEAARLACAEWFYDETVTGRDGDVFGSWVLDLSRQTVHQ